MLSRYEYLYTKKKAKSLSDKLFEFENGRLWDERKKEFQSDETYKKYKAYMGMTQGDKEKLDEQWILYYKKCSESEYGKIFWAMKPLFLAGDMAGVRELAKKSKELQGVKPIDKPSSIDPNELLMKMNLYFTLVLSDLIEEYAEIYEKKDDKAVL